MKFALASSPFGRKMFKTPDLMRLVILCLLPGIFVQWYVFGWGNLIQIAIAGLFAVITEAVIVAIRQRPVLPTLRDNSALLTGVLLGISLPPYTPWWMTAIGIVFAILVAKHLYGGLGQNLFNPAMVAYVLLLISFPVHMTSWAPPEALMQNNVTLADAWSMITTGFSIDGYSLHQIKIAVDGTTMATPLDTLKTDLGHGLTTSESMAKPIFGTFAGYGTEWVSFAFLIGGLVLLKQKAIGWQIPVSFIAGLFLFALIGYLGDPDASASPLLHLFSGATMFAAFFILTDPVTASTTVRGRIIFGLLIALLTYVIRTWGGYPDAVAFAVILANMCVPLIDYYTQPVVYGSKKA
ncbi:MULTISPECIES: electron transport complex subunit RsxD [unclassified Motilimonas]|uniref:electron transport complex subunit RsxD n=1 Tax=unclassified Motilimonas TaxID=2643697 RepID=UPI001E4A7031|nr:MULTISPECIES: electron transport complex subunit RsxD [unclassified Motilimonas]MCE0555556.1 electron transport complex subunit RsxD [Motilimonas sp. E26]MDO6527714.1 electron transport complex subunit RsxD [Motilimonas sp. 1_MG-2023]